MKGHAALFFRATASPAPPAVGEAASRKGGAPRGEVIERPASTAPHGCDMSGLPFERHPRQHDTKLSGQSLDIGRPCRRRPLHRANSIGLTPNASAFCCRLYADYWPLISKARCKRLTTACSVTLIFMRPLRWSDPNGRGWAKGEKGTS